MDYYQYIGQKVKTCEGEGCNKRVLVKNIRNTSQKYCKECSKEILQKNWRESKKKMRKISKKQ